MIASHESPLRRLADTYAEPYKQALVEELPPAYLFHSAPVCSNRLQLRHITEGDVARDVHGATGVGVAFKARAAAGGEFTPIRGMRPGGTVGARNYPAVERSIAIIDEVSVLYY